MSSEVVELLQDLVRTPSVNPMGRDVSGDIYLEHRMTARLEQWFETLEVPWKRYTVMPDRDNIAAVFHGAPDAPIIVLEAHQDTVPIDGMIIEPFDPVIEGGKMFGRGSCDIKGGMACMMTAFKRLVETPPENPPTVMMACSVNEEFGMAGAANLCHFWQPGEYALVEHEPTCVIVAEPTLLNVVVAHKGVARFHVYVDGVACHSSQPELGHNAIYRMSRIIDLFEEYATEVVPTLGEHPRCGKPTLSVGMISGGISVNTVPDFCQIEIDRRVLPEEEPRDAFNHITKYISGKLRELYPEWADDVRFSDDPNLKYGLTDSFNGPLASSLQSIIQSMEIDCELMGVPYGTDAKAFSRAGIQTVVLGPGSIDQAHTKDEWVEIDQLEKAVEVYWNAINQLPALL